MNFKIDTKTNYTVIEPLSNLLDAKMTAAIAEKWTELVKNNAPYLILDLINCKNAEEQIFSHLKALHESFYENGQSLVFTNLQADVKKTLQQVEDLHAINIAPTMIEAIDIVSMEKLERDFLNDM